jgi:hypothetical protein
VVAFGPESLALDPFGGNPLIAEGHQLRLFFLSGDRLYDVLRPPRESLVGQCG